MSWAEIMELREELKDIRRTVGGDSIKLSKDGKPITRFDDDLEKTNQVISSLKDDIENLRDTVQKLNRELDQVKAIGLADQALDTKTEALFNEIRLSTDKLDEEVKSRGKR